MFISRSFLLLLLVLSGCAGPDAGPWPAWSWPSVFKGKGAPGPAGSSSFSAGAYVHFEFGWLLSGAPEIMPVQVFDDGERMWLQFPPEGAWPAVFDVNSSGWRPLAYRRDGPYMVLEGVHEHLALRGGHLQGAIRRAGHIDSFGAARPQQAREAGQSITDTGVPIRKAVPPADAGGMAETGAAFKPPVAVPAADKAVQDTLRPSVVAAERSSASGLAVGVKEIAVPGTAIAPAGMDASPSFPGESGQGMMISEARPRQVIAEHSSAALGGFSVGPADVTMRQALERWASSSGWTFSAEHWAVDVDIPLVGEARFTMDFKSAVRELLAATEMGDRPLQPCFYSNRVVRVVPYAQPCDRRKGMGAMS